MPIATYTDLQSSVADWLNRSDLSAVIPTFIQLAEAKFNRELRTRDMLTRSEAISLELNYVDTPPQQPLAYVGPAEAKVLKANHIAPDSYSGGAGAVRYFTIIDGAFELLPAPISNVDLLLTYYAKVPALASNASNWLLTKSPDLYLYSALLEAAPYLKNDERIAVWAGARQKVIDDMRIESERASRPTTQIAARRRGFY